MSGRRFSGSDGDHAMRAAGLTEWVQHTKKEETPPKDQSPPVFESQNHKLYDLLHDDEEGKDDKGEDIEELARRPSIVDNFQENEEEKLVLT